AVLEAHAGRVEARVVGDLGPREHERDPPDGQVEAERHLGVTLVRPVAEAGEAAETAPGVVEVVVGALVVVLLARVRMHQVIGVEENEPGGHGPKLGGLALCFQAARPWQSAARAIDHRAGLRSPPTIGSPSASGWPATATPSTWAAGGRCPSPPPTIAGSTSA